MFHAGGHKGVGTRGRSSGLGRHYPHYLGLVDWKAPLRCGILFCTFSSILFVIGVILTWLGVHDVFGESVPITGPILLAVGVLMLLLALRQFYMAHVRKKAHNKALQNKELQAKVLKKANENEDGEEQEPMAADELQKLKKDTEDEDNSCAIIDETSEKPPLLSHLSYEPGLSTASNGDPYPYSSGTCVRSPISLQSPYYSMALMVYKDPSLIYGPYVSAASTYSESYTCPMVATTASTGGATSSSSSLPPVDPAVLDTPSTTLSQQAHSTYPSSSLQATSGNASVPDCNKIFPADYLTNYQRSVGTTATASAGISNLPNPTAFMMIRTLELQETI